MNDPNDKPEQCHVCGKDVSNGWFARIWNAEEWLLLCNPACAMRYYDSVRPEPNPCVQQRTINGHTFRFLVNGELWSEV